MLPPWTTAADCSYKGGADTTCGMDNWGQVNSMCAGDAQSPIDVIPPGKLCGEAKHPTLAFPKLDWGAAECTVLLAKAFALVCAVAVRSSSLLRSISCVSLSST